MQKIEKKKRTNELIFFYLQGFTATVQSHPFAFYIFFISSCSLTTYTPTNFELLQSTQKTTRVKNN